MKLRKGKFGEFYGCTGYPLCFNTMSKNDVELELDTIEPDNDYDDPSNDDK